MQFTPYLSFQGECTRAFTEYAKVFGGNLELMRFSDMPPGENTPPLEPDQAGWVMHASLALPDGGMLMGADMPPQFGGQRMAGMSVAVSLPDAAQARAAFDSLAVGGQVGMDFGPTFFSPGFGMVVDQFGTPWMIMAADPAQG